MKRNRHTPEQIIGKLRDADAMLGSGQLVASTKSVSACAVETARMVTAQIRLFIGHLPDGILAPGMACA